MIAPDRYDQLLAALTKARRRNGLTQTEVAEKLGRVQSFVSKYEQGERRLDVIEFIDVCSALSEDPFQILQVIVRQQ
jgi:transcriptional regulator with XRE-family HTH domain